MRVHVERQVVDLMERFVADATFVLFISRMREFVVLVVALLVEPFAAVFADERLVSLVDAHVGVESR